MYVIDDFHPLGADLRKFALEQKYIDWTGYDGAVYKRICLTHVPYLQSMLESLLGPVDMLGMGFRLNYEGELPNTNIHSDMGWGTHALVLYLSEGISGTAFWKHKETGESRIDPGDAELFDKIKDSWDNEADWEMERLVDMKFNRAVIYESALFHSRYPFTGFGSDPETGRLIAVAFFTPRNKI